MASNPEDPLQRIARLGRAASNPEILHNPDDIRSDCIGFLFVACRKRAGLPRIGVFALRLGLTFRVLIRRSGAIRLIVKVVREFAYPVPDGGFGLLCQRKPPRSNRRPLSG